MARPLMTEGRGGGDPGEARGPGQRGNLEWLLPPLPLPENTLTGTSELTLQALLLLPHPYIKQI